MKFSYDWLKRHLDTDKSVYEVADVLTSLGMEVESVIDEYDYLNQFKVSTVEDIKKHPDSDHLKICSVNNGSEILTIVTGADNVQVGGKYPLAQIGTVIPNGNFTIEKRKLVGVNSYGMLCSASELNIPFSDMGGLFNLPQSAVNGMSIGDALKLHYYILDVSLTPNRGDCFGVRGIASDLAAKGVGKLKDIKIPSLKVSTSFPYTLTADEAVYSTCKIFAALVIKNIHNTESPAWLKNFLKSAGISPKNVIVDVTNFVNIDLARPLHAYDMNLIDGKNITVRHANNDSEFLDLKQNVIKLNDNVVVVADEQSAISIIGIIGGDRTKCSLNTTDVLLESVYLEPERIMESGQMLNVTSESRIRFERGVGTDTLILGLKIAAAMITEVCGGEISDIVLTNTYRAERNDITITEDDFDKLIGMRVVLHEIENILKNLGMTVVFCEKGLLTVRAPSYRYDINCKEDLIEEVLRVIGYDSVQDAAFVSEPLLTSKSDDEKDFENLRGVRKFLCAYGYDETVNYSFVSSEDKSIFIGEKAAVEIMNPISNEFSFLRTSVMISLVKTIKKLLSYGENSASIFEIGAEFHSEDKINRAIAGMKFESASKHKIWNEKNSLDIFDVKRDALAVLKLLGVDIDKVEIEENDVQRFMYQSRAGVIKVNSIIVATFGELNPRLLKQIGIEVKVFGFSVNYDELISNLKIIGVKPKMFAPVLLQKLERDFAFVCNKNIKAAVLVNAIKLSDERIIRVDLFDLYSDEILGEDRVSMAFNVLIDQKEITMQDKDIKKISDKIIKNVAKVGGILR